MLNKFFNSIRRIGGSEFSSYYTNVQRRGGSSGPTADEARRDFQASFRMSPWGRV